MKKLLLALTTAMAALLPNAEAQLAVGPSGLGPLNFDIIPPVEEFSTLSVAGGNNTITTVAQMETAVQLLSAAGINAMLGTSATVPPSTSGTFRWNSTALYLASRTTGNAYNVLEAHLLNDTGTDLPAIVVSYDFGAIAEGAGTIVEDAGLAGLRAYYSLSGEPDSWALIPEFTTATAGSLTAIISFPDTWGEAQPLYIIWTDDNGVPGSGGGSGNIEGGYTIDNFTVGVEVTTGISIITPTEGQNFVEGTPVPINVSASPNITSVDFILDGNLLGTDTTPPYGVVANGLSLGEHSISAVGHHSGGMETAGPIDITVSPNQPPTVVITAPTNHPYHLVGWALTNTVAVADPDGTIASVVWSIDGEPKFTNTGTVFIYESSLAGDHTVGVEVTDNNGATVTASTDFTIYNPPTPPYTLLVTNGSLWRYYNTSNEPPVDGGGLAWNQPGYDDELWLSGIGQLGNGDNGEGRPKRTPIDIGVGTRYTTIYFRHEFSVADPGLFTNLVLRLEVDDGAVVYINGLEVASYNMPPGPWTYDTFAPAAEANDGRYFVNLNIDLVNGPQGNPLEEINSLAVEVHQTSATSSDLTFDLMLWGEESHVADGPNIAADGDGNVVITWNNYAYDGYSLQGTETLESDPNATVWTTILTGIPGLAIVPATLPHQFFRLFHP